VGIFLRAILGACFFVLSSGQSFSQDKPIDSYYARLSAQDHFNTKGQRLTDVAAIIRQDRANFHVFGRIDPEDDDDSFFALKENRQKLENMIANSRVTKAARQEIINGTPLIHVEIYRDYVNVTIR